MTRRKHHRPGPNHQQAQHLTGLLETMLNGGEPLPPIRGDGWEIPFEHYLENHLDTAYGRGVRHEREGRAPDNPSEENSYEYERLG